MKKNVRKRPGDRAVSPVIATILMVAITVVLAAVLYLMVSQFTGPNTPTPPTGTMSANSAAGGNETLGFGRYSPETAPTEIRLIVALDGVDQGECTFGSDDDGPLTCDAGVAGNMTYTDQADNKRLNVGDSIAFGDGGGLATGTWVIKMIHIDSGEEIESIQFTK